MKNLKGNYCKVIDGVCSWMGEVCLNPVTDSKGCPVLKAIKAKGENIPV
jgi:hypothetical protein